MTTITYPSSPEVAAHAIRKEFDDLVYGQMLLVGVVDAKQVNVRNLRPAMGATFCKALVARERALIELLGGESLTEEELATRVERVLDRIVERVLELEEDDA